MLEEVFDSSSKYTVDLSLEQNALPVLLSATISLSLYVLAACSSSSQTNAMPTSSSGVRLLQVGFAILSCLLVAGVIFGKLALASSQLVVKRAC
jgi:hypothetical protein